MKKLFLVMTLLQVFTICNAEKKEFKSPDGRLLVVVSDENGSPSYSVNYNGILFLKPSPLGLRTNIGDFSHNMYFAGDVKTSAIDETYQLRNIKQSKVHYTATEAVCSFMQQGKRIFDVVFRISNKDVAFKYKIFSQGETIVVSFKKKLPGLCFLKAQQLSFARKVNQWVDLLVHLPVTKLIIR